MSRQKAQPGYTLVEVLVVLAIIAIITGISAPAMLRFARMMGEDTREAAHEVQRLLRWAQVHSASNGVDTAVVYNINVVPDSMAGDDPVRIIDGMGLMRRLRRDEFDEIRQMLVKLYGRDFVQDELALRHDRLVVPLSMEDEGGYIFRQLPEGTCILPVYADYGTDDTPRFSYAILDGYADPSMRLHTPRVHQTPGLNRRLNGYSRVQVLDLTNYDLEEIVREYNEDEVNPPDPWDLFVGPRPDPYMEDNDNRLDDSDRLSYGGALWSFPAHIFRPDGQIETLHGDIARLEVKVGVTPDRGFDERFVEDAELPMEFSATGYREDQDVEILWERGHTLELFTTTGRVRLE